MGIRLSSGSRCPQSPEVKRSTHKILTTHVGSLPAPEGLTGEVAVRKLVERQRELGLDIINEGEYTKGGDWLSFTDRFLQVGLRTRHAVLRAGRSNQESAESLDLYRPRHLHRPDGFAA